MKLPAGNIQAPGHRLAIQRLTALWAFTESGLGGMLHALQAPFTGLIVGGISVMLIMLIAYFSQPGYRQILKSVVVVLIVKAIVSPHTPFTAYIAVSFQAVVGYLVCRVAGIRLWGIFFTMLITMLESAVQKLLIITLFFGKSFWIAADELIKSITRQLGMGTSHGSYWLVSLYFGLHAVGAVFFTWLTYKTIHDIFSGHEYPLPERAVAKTDIPVARKKRFGKLWISFFILLLIAVLLYIFAGNREEGWLNVLQAISWTLAAIMLWYLIINPLLTRLIRNFLHKKQSRYSEQVAETLALLPLTGKIASLAWQQSRQHKGWKRFRYFFSALVQWTLTCPDENIAG